MASLQYFKYSVMTQCAVKNQGKGLASSWAHTGYILT